MNDFGAYFFSDPFIRPNPSIPGSPPPSHTPTPISPVQPPQSEPTQSPSTGPQITQNLNELPNINLIVYRSGKACSISRGPDIRVPIFNCDITGGLNDGHFNVNCVSTYPNIAPFNPIADRFEVRHFRDSFFLTLADGCGLHPSSRLAPQAAIEGFWNDLIPKLQNDSGSIDVHKLAHYMQSAIKAAHFNIYWDAYFRSQEGFEGIKTKDSYPLNILSQSARNHLVEDEALIKKALAGDTAMRKALVDKHLGSKFYEGYAGATTFLCSALVKDPSSSEFPYQLLTINLGDGQCFSLRENQLTALTQDSRKDLSNLRDPGGKMGLCTPTPLKLDDRNLQFSLTPCQPGDFLVFVTDGVLDNLNPERLGCLPEGSKTPFWVQEKICDAAGLNLSELQPILDILDANVLHWRDLELQKSNQLQRDFSLALLQALINKQTDLDKVSEAIIKFCHSMTDEHRDPNSNTHKLYGYAKPLGKPDHTTCLSYQIP